MKSSLWALDNGCGVVICNGMKYNTIRKIMRGQKVGSFFTKAEPDTVPVEILGCNSIDIWNLRLELGQGLRASIGMRFLAVG